MSTHPDNSTPRDDSGLEEMLRRLPADSLPPSWRQEILRQAEAPAWPWFGMPVRLGLAAAWVAIGILHLETPRNNHPLPQVAWSPGAIAWEHVSLFDHPDFVADFNTQNEP